MRASIPNSQRASPAFRTLRLRRLLRWTRWTSWGATFCPFKPSKFRGQVSPRGARCPHMLVIMASHPTRRVAWGPLAPPTSPNACQPKRAHADHQRRDRRRPDHNHYQHHHTPRYKTVCISYSCISVCISQSACHSWAGRITPMRHPYSSD